MNAKYTRLLLVLSFLDYVVRFDECFYIKILSMMDINKTAINYCVITVSDFD